MIRKTVTEVYENNKLVSRTTDEEFVEEINRSGITFANGANDSASSAGFAERYPHSHTETKVDVGSKGEGKTLGEAVAKMFGDALDNARRNGVR